jgi:hypothetical protein
MRKLVLLLGVLCCCAATAAMAGPNAGGVLWVHNTGKTFTSGPVFGPDPAVCPTSINATMALWNGVLPAPVGTYWKVYAAFPAGSSPRLKSVGWGTSFPDPDTSPSSYVKVIGADRVPPETAATVFFISGAGFPTNSSTIGQSFPPGARTTLVTPLFMFWGFGYQYPDAPLPSWCTVPKTGDDNFGDDQIPANTDQIAGYGCMGFGTPGFVPCPVLPTGACCNTAVGMPSCQILSAAACAALGTTWAFLGNNVPCNVQTCPPVLVYGACCWLDGHCTVTTSSDCFGDGSPHWTTGGTCVPNLCVQPPATGACCNTAVGFPSCNIITAAACQALGSAWAYLGDNVPCSVQTCPVPPPPTGGCCNLAIGFPTCNVMTATECAALGTPWVYLGNNVACNIQTCPPPPPPNGACCWIDGHCTVTTEAGCFGDGSPHWTLGGTCNPNLCVQPPPVTGACCDRVLGFPACTITTQAACALPLVWLGANVPCDVITCPPPPPPVTGACCNLLVGMPDCHISTQLECVAPYTWLGADVPCDVQHCPVPPPPVTGACCNLLVGMPACTITTQAACLAPYTWLGVDVPCNVQTCPVPVVTGNCCNHATPACLITTQEACVAAGFEWLGSVACNVATNCQAPPPPEGACCWLDGHCTISTQVGCLGDGTPHWTLAGICSPNPCDQPPPPPNGACCWLDGHCTVTTQTGCLGTGTPLWTLGGTCIPNLCTPPVPTERTSWGQIKNIYR